MTDDELDEDVGDIDYSLGHYYGTRIDRAGRRCPPGLDGALRAIFEDLAGADAAEEPLAPAGALIRRLEPDADGERLPLDRPLPERTRVLVRYLAERADELRAGIRRRPRGRGASWR